MTPTRSPAPSGDRIYLTDGGIETTLIFHEGQELPYFAAFHLLREARGREVLRSYYRPYARLAERLGTGLVLESATWRANPDWGARLGYSPRALAEANGSAIEVLREVRDELRAGVGPVVISGCIGPRGDGYATGAEMSPDQARRYHAVQAHALAEAGADMLCAITMTYTNEAIGVVGAAREAGVPVAISFTVETDGRLPSGEGLEQAVRVVDDETGGYATYFMINCAHPSHFDHALERGAEWAGRIGGLRANASRMSHAELDGAAELDTGDPVDLAARYAALRADFPRISVLGGCCGTDHRHVEQIAVACGAGGR